MGILATLSIVDVIALCFILLNALWGLQRGLSGELARVGSVILAFVIGLAAYGHVGEWLAQQSRLGPRAALATAFVVTIMGAFVAMLFLRLLLKRVFEVAIAERHDRTAGFIAGTVRATLIVIIVFIAMNLQTNADLNRKFGEESVLGTLLLRHMSQLVEHIESATQNDQEVEAGKS